MQMFCIMGGQPIPWDMIAPHERQAERNHYQSLRTLHSRGGLSPCEAVAVLEDRPWRRMADKDAADALAGHLARYKERTNA